MTEKEHWDNWEKLERLKLDLLKKIYLEEKVQSIFLFDVWTKVFQKTFEEARTRASAIRQISAEELKDYFFQEYGSVNLDDILGEEPLK